MVIETFLRGAAPVYERAAERGRMLPAGLSYVDSWVDDRLERCFQLMETDEPGLFEEWTGAWSDRPKPPRALPPPEPRHRSFI